MLLVEQEDTLELELREGLPVLLLLGVPEREAPLAREALELKQPEAVLEPVELPLVVEEPD